MLLDDFSVPPGMRVYAVGDVHGRADLLADMFAMIDADLRERPAEQRRLVMLGDYTDRGPNSREVIDMLIERGEAWGADFICLRGNHDDWLETFLVAPDEVGDNFLRWGGMETLASYGVDTAGPRRSDSELSHELNHHLPTSHRRFLARLKPFHVEGDYFFAHAGVRPGVALEEQDPHDLMWIRGEFHRHLDPFDKVIVHGHTPNDEVEVFRNRINVDTYAYASGVLTPSYWRAGNTGFADRELKEIFNSLEMPDSRASKPSDRQENAAGFPHMAFKVARLVALAALTAAVGWTPAIAQEVQSQPLAPPTQELPQQDPGQQAAPEQQPEQGPTIGQDIEQPQTDLGQIPQDYQDRIENKVAEFYGIDKITGRIITFDVYINETVRFGALHVTPRVCYSRPATETPKTTSFVEVDEITLDRQIRRIFTGWMFADSPGLNAIEHPVYDIWLKDCKMTSDEAPPPS